MVHPIERLRYVARSQGLDANVLAQECAEALGDLGFDSPALVVAVRRLLDAHPECGPLWWVAAHVLAADHPTSTARHVADELAVDPTSDELASALPGGAHVVVSGSPAIIRACMERPDLTIDVVTDVGANGGWSSWLGERTSARTIDIDELDAAFDVDLGIVPIIAASAAGYILREADARIVKQMRAFQHEVWLVAGVGHVLPVPLFETCASRLGLLSSESDKESERVGDAWSYEAVGQKRFRVLRSIGAADVVVGPDGPFLPRLANLRSTCPVPGELLAG